MTPIVVDAALPSKLYHITEPIKRLDDTGRVLAALERL